MKSPRQDYHHNTSMPEAMPPMTTMHEIPPPPMPYANDDRMLQQQTSFPFPPLLMPPTIENENVPTDLRVMTSKNCPCATVQDLDEPQNLAYRSQRHEIKESESDSDAEIDLTSHSSKDDDLRESERLANRIATSIFRSDTVLHDLVPNDLSLGAVKNGSNVSSLSRNNL